MVQASRYSFPDDTLSDYILPKPYTCLIVALLLLNLAALTVLGVVKTTDVQDGEEIAHQAVSKIEIGEGTAVSARADTVLLESSADMGQAYIDSMVFFGESTTAHLRSRGVLSGGTASAQVWANESNTMMLSTEILKQKIIYPETGERMTIAQAAAKKQPKYLVLAFGVNGLSQFASNPRLYSLSYAKLIAAVHEASPKTTVILQTVYPVAHQYRDAVRVNADIERLNAMLPEIAATNGAYVVDTASVLRDEYGMLRAEYAMEDGLHLRRQAYTEILQYLRVHGCP